MEDTITVHLDNRNVKWAKDLRLIIEVERTTYIVLQKQAQALRMPVNVLVAAQIIERINEGGAYTVVPEVPF